MNTAVATRPKRDVTTKSPNARSRADFAKLINEAWQSTLDGIFQTGLRLETAKAELPHGEWLAMIADDLPFGEDTAQNLIRIAKDDRITNTEHVRYLPVAWGTLYQLTKLDDETFAAAIEDGRINSKMARKDALALRPPPKHRKSRKPKTAPAQATPDRSRLPDPIAACLVDVLRIVNETVLGTTDRAAIDPAARAKLFAELHAAIDRARERIEQEESQ